MSQKSERERQVEQQRRHQYHQQIMGQGQGEQGAQVLKQLAENRDLPIQPEDDEIIGQFTAEAASEANLSDEEYESIKWEREIDMVMWLCQQPTEGGMHGSWQGWAHGDKDKAQEPLDPRERATVESYATTHKEVLSLSKSGFAVKESARNVSETHVNEGEQNKSSGGLMGKLGLK